MTRQSGPNDLTVIGIPRAGIGHSCPFWPNGRDPADPFTATAPAWARLGKAPPRPAANVRVLHVGVEPTKGAAERALRHGAVRRKTGGQLKWGAVSVRRMPTLPACFLTWKAMGKNVAVEAMHAVQVQTICPALAIMETTGEVMFNGHAENTLMDDAIKKIGQLNQHVRDVDDQKLKRTRESTMHGTPDQ